MALSQHYPEGVDWRNMAQGGKLRREPDPVQKDIQNYILAKQLQYERNDKNAREQKLKRKFNSNGFGFDSGGADANAEEAAGGSRSSRSSSGSEDTPNKQRHQESQKLVDNEEVLFDSQGHAIVLAKHTDFAKLGTATKKGKFRNALEQEIPFNVDEETQLLLREGGHIAVYKSSQHFLDTCSSGDEFEPGGRERSPKSPNRTRRSILWSTERKMQMLKQALIGQTQGKLDATREKKKDENRKLREHFKNLPPFKQHDLMSWLYHDIKYQIPNLDKTL